MPDRDVKTIRDLIYYQYAKIVVKRALAMENGKAAKKDHYGFIKMTFRDLKSGKKKWSEIIREDWQFVESDKECIYCGRSEGLHKEHIVPKSLNIKSECGNCDIIQGIHNQIWACRECNSKKGVLGLYGFYKLVFSNDKKYYDRLPILVEKKYLKTILNCHECAYTLDGGDIDGDGELSVLDIDWIINKYTNRT